jgi:DNA-binding transcriptional LysR family regulator
VPGDVRVVRLRSPLSRRIYAVWREEAARRPAIRAAIEALRAAAPVEVPPFEPVLGALAGAR